MKAELFRAWVSKRHDKAVRIKNTLTGKAGIILILDGQPKGESYQFYLQYDDRTGEWMQEGDFIERMELEEAAHLEEVT